MCYGDKVISIRKLAVLHQIARRIDWTDWDATRLALRVEVLLGTRAGEGREQFREDLFRLIARLIIGIVPFRRQHLLRFRYSLLHEPSDISHAELIGNDPSSHEVHLPVCTVEHPRPCPPLLPRFAPSDGTLKVIELDCILHAHDDALLNRNIDVTPLRLESLGLRLPYSHHRCDGCELRSSQVSLVAMCCDWRGLGITTEIEHSAKCERDDIFRLVL